MVSPAQRAALETAVIDLFERHRKDIVIDALRHLYFGGFYSNPLEDFSLSEDFTETVAGANVLSGLFGSVAGAFAGGCQLPDGRILFAPHNANQIAVTDPDSYGSLLTGSLTGTQKYMGAVLGSNSRAFCAPFNASAVLEFNPIGNVVTTFGNYAGTAKWSGFVPSPTNGSLYAVPYNFGSVLRVIASSRAVSTITPTNMGSVTDGKWRGGCYVPATQSIVCAPFNHPGCLVINPAAGTAAVQNVFPTLPQGAFSGCLLWRNGNIYFIPYNADAVYVLNPTTNVVTKFGNLPLGGQKWMGARLAPNGNIYCVPYNHESILEIDPANQELRFIGKFEGTQKWMGGVLTQYGNLLTIPHDNAGALSILGTRMSGPDWWNISAYTNFF
jgi:DNA-binding beta-propeller fold protein YncE